MRAACPACGPASPLAVIGLSMGGFAALRLAGKYPERFVGAAAHSAAIDAADLDPLVEGSRQDWSTAPVDCSAMTALCEASSALPPIHVECGVDDPYLDRNRALHDALDKAGIMHDYAERPGGHDWPYWRANLDASLGFVGAAISARRRG